MKTTAGTEWICCCSGGVPTFCGELRSGARLEKWEEGEEQQMAEEKIEGVWGVEDV